MLRAVLFSASTRTMFAAAVNIVFIAVVDAIGAGILATEWGILGVHLVHQRPYSCKQLVI